MMSFVFRFGFHVKVSHYVYSNTGRLQRLTPVIPTLWEAKVGRSLKTRSLRPVGPRWQNPVSTKNTKISWVWWQAPVAPATLEAEA